MKNKSIFTLLDSFLFKENNEKIIERFGRTLEQCADLILNETNYSRKSNFADRFNPLYGYTLCVYNHAKILNTNGYYYRCYFVLKKEMHFPFCKDSPEGILGYKGDDLIQALGSAMWDKIAQAQRN